MKKVYIINLKRSAIGKYGGKLASFAATDIASMVIKDILTIYPRIKNKIDGIILGNVLSANLGQNPARIAAHKAGLPFSIPSLTINEACASGLKSLVVAAQTILLNEAECMLAGGMENMSRCPHYLENYRFGVKFGSQVVKDGLMIDGLYCGLTGKHMGLITEKIIKKFNISRNSQDKYALTSHQKATDAIKKGKFIKEIIPIFVNNKNKKFIFDYDEGPRKDTSLLKLSQLSSVFKRNGTITAGNASSLNDAAAISLLASEEFVKKHNLKPLALIKNYSSVGLNPNYFGLGAYYAIEKCLIKSKLSKHDINLWEINEAFAGQMIAVLKLLNVNPDIINVNGGAIALGHPLGASGARILTTLTYELKRRKLKYGMAALCVGGGQGIAMLIENI
jgi:acetyl-CoA C-acetyltransferase